VQRRLPFGHGGPERLAIQGHDVPWDLLPYIANPGQEAFSEALGIQEQENSVDGVGTWESDR
jgi:hypothetical protein